MPGPEELWQERADCLLRCLPPGEAVMQPRARPGPRAAMGVLCQATKLPQALTGIGFPLQVRL